MGVVLVGGPGEFMQQAIKVGFRNNNNKKHSFRGKVKSKVQISECINGGQPEATPVWCPPSISLVCRL